MGEGEGEGEGVSEFDGEDEISDAHTHKWERRIRSCTSIDIEF
jgi:hypothetical protein